ncbi:MAG: extracellular solute-binding protein [Candidatus Competibacterales bacterium]|nr:extracellular solute-binding protein [Candidatus Competibacterales bacterium]
MNCARVGDRRSRNRPEGPYESADLGFPLGISNHRMSVFLDFLEQLEQEKDCSLELKPSNRETRMQIALIRNHLDGKLTTSSSLAAASGLSYGTAIRAIDAMIAAGLILRRARTRTGKSFSLHPTEHLLEQWREMFRRTQALLSSTLQLHTGTCEGLEGYFYGASYCEGNVIAPPPILENKLELTGGRLGILAHADPTFMAMHALKKQFESMLGVEIKIRALSIDRLREEILDNAAARTSRYDIVACDLPWFGEMAAADILLPLDGLIRDSQLDIQDFHPEALASARYHGCQYGIPVQTAPELLVVRRDLLAAAGIEAPRTTEQTLAAARRLHDPFNGVAGIAWNGARGTPLGHSFLFVMGAFGQPVINLRRTHGGFDGEWVEGEHFRPMFLSAAASAAAEYLVELLQYSPRNVLGMSWYERARCYAEGHVAMAHCGTLLAPLFERDERSPACGRTAYLPLPRGPGGRPIAPIGGYALGIPSNIASERIDPIWTALRSMTSRQAVKLYIENGSLVSPRFSTNLDPEVQRISPVIAVVDEMARTGVLKMWPRPPVPEIADVIAIAGEELHDMLMGVRSIEQALRNAQNRADALMRSHGHY